MNKIRRAAVLRGALLGTIAVGWGIAPPARCAPGTPATVPATQPNPWDVPHAWDALLPEGWKNLGLTELAALDARLKSDISDNAHHAASEVEQYAWATYLSKESMLDNADATTQSGWLRLAGHQKLDAKRMAQVAKTLTDRFIAHPQRIGAMTVAQINDLLAALDNTSDSSQVVIDTAQEWALHQQKVGGDQELAPVLGLLALDRSRQGQAALSHLVDVILDGYLAGAAAPLGDNRLISFVRRMGSALPQDAQKALRQKITRAFADDSALGKVTPRGLGELRMSLGLLGMSWQERMAFSARWVVAQQHACSVPELEAVGILASGAQGQALTSEDGAAHLAMAAVAAAHDRLRERGSAATSDERFFYDSILTDWAGILPIQERQKLEVDASLVGLLTPQGLQRVHDALARDPATVNEAASMEQTWINALPGVASPVTAVSWNQMMGQRARAIPALQALASRITAEQRAQVAAALAKQLRAFHPMIGDATLLEIADLQNLKAFMGDSSCAEMVDWLATERAWVTQPLVWDRQGFLAEEREVPLLLVLEQSKKQLSLWLPTVAAALQKSHIALRADAARYLTYAFLMDGMKKEWLAVIESKLRDNAIVGDARAQWFLVRASLAEAAIDPEVDPTSRALTPELGVSWAKKALEAARTQPMGLACIGYMAGRYSACGKCAEAAKVLEDSAKQFRDADSAGRLAQWRQIVADVQAAQTAALADDAKVVERHRLEGQLAAFKEQVAAAKAQHKSPESVASLEKFVAATELRLKQQEQ
jgi:hypothetical protein